MIKKKLSNESKIKNIQLIVFHCIYIYANENVSI